MLLIIPMAPQERPNGLQHPSGEAYMRFIILTFLIIYIIISHLRFFAAEALHEQTEHSVRRRLFYAAKQVWRDACYACTRARRDLRRPLGGAVPSVPLVPIVPMDRRRPTRLALPSAPIAPLAPIAFASHRAAQVQRGFGRTDPTCESAIIATPWAASAVPLLFHFSNVKRNLALLD